MLTIIFVFLLVIGVSYVIRTPKVILVMILILLGVISLLTPFWPLVFIGLLAFYFTNDKKSKEELAKERYKYEEYKHQEHMFERKEHRKG